MKNQVTSLLVRSGIAAVLAACSTARTSDPLPSWNQGSSKQAVMAFVTEVTTVGGPGFVPADQRVAVFDNDGTLWAEQPAYAQIAFAIDRVKALAPQHPEWRERQPFKGVLEDDLGPLIAGGDHALLDLVMATHAGGTTEEFEQTVRQWIASAKHPTTGRPYTSMVYQPMLELLAYLRANGFKTFIVSGGGIEFMRPWVQEVYGIPPEQVVGSSIRTKFEIRDGQPVLIRLAEVDFVNDGPGKPAGIHQYVGRRPIAAFGNSDGDLAMLQWTCGGGGQRLCLYVHHTDSAREWAYDRRSGVGRLDRGLDEAAANGWTVVDMKQDWRQIFAPEIP
jgi:phosphoserine phosphatase